MLMAKLAYTRMSQEQVERVLNALAEIDFSWEHAYEHPDLCDGFMKELLEKING